MELTFSMAGDSGKRVRLDSVAGGRRYDGLIARFLGKQRPATGFSIGVSKRCVKYWRGALAWCGIDCFAGAGPDRMTWCLEHSMLSRRKVSAHPNGRRRAAIFRLSFRNGN